ncbi:MAG: hypothetical protein ABMA26_15020 [Limisphaerales bacterium]
MAFRKTRIKPATAYRYGLHCAMTRAAAAEYMRFYRSVRKLVDWRRARNPNQLSLHL